LSSIPGYLFLYLIRTVPQILVCQSDEWKEPVLEYLSLIGIAGLIVGAIILGAISDIFGRKPSLISGNVILAASMIGCAFVEDAVGFAGVFFFVGVGAGGNLIQPVVYAVEVMPIRFRSLGTFGMYGLSLVGVLISLGIAIPTMAKGWQFWLGINAIFPLLAALCTLGIPESPLFKLSKQDTAKDAIGTLQLAVRLNSGSLPTGRLLLKEAENRGNPMGAFDPKIRMTSMLIFVAFVSMGILLTGQVMTKDSLLKNEGNCGNQTHGAMYECLNLEIRSVVIDEIKIEAINLAAVLVGVVLAETVGRKFSILGLTVLSGFLLFIDIACFNLLVVKIMTSIVGVCVLAALLMLELFVLETYDCEMRSVMMGTGYALLFVAAIVGAFIMEVLFKSSIMAALIFVGLIAVVTGIIVGFVPNDTKSKSIE